MKADEGGSQTQAEGGFSQKIVRKFFRWGREAAREMNGEVFQRYAIGKWGAEHLKRNVCLRCRRALTSLHEE